MKPAKVQLGGKEWTVRLSARKLKGHVGSCDPATKTIVLCRSLPEHDRRGVLIHECMHSLFWAIDESVVDAGAQELSDILDQLDM